MVDLVAITVIDEQILEAITGLVEFKNAHGFLVRTSFCTLFSALIGAQIRIVFMRHATTE